MKKYISDIILYLCIGCFSYFVLVTFTDIPIKHQNTLITPKAFLAVSFIFCSIGLSVRYVNEKLKSYYQYFLKDRKAFLIGMAISATSLLALNYLTVSLSRYMVGMSSPFTFQAKGISMILSVWLVEMIVVGQFMQNRFYSDLVRLYKREEELERANAEAKYRALQSQLNPHFLFNNLNTLISEIEYSPENAIEFTRNLSDTYRYILLCQDKSTVQLYEEFEFIEKYIELHKVRLGDCIIIDNKLDEKFLDTLVPPLTMQLLIENIIKHNVINMSRPMTIRIYHEKSEKNEWICISNPIRPKQGVNTTGKGLANLMQRYRMLYSKDIVVDKTQDIFTVKLPLIYE